MFTISSLKCSINFSFFPTTFMSIIYKFTNIIYLIFFPLFCANRLYTNFAFKKKEKKIVHSQSQNDVVFFINVMFKTASFSFFSKNVNQNSSLVEPLIFLVSPFTATFPLPLLFTSSLQMLLM